LVLVGTKSIGSMNTNYLETDLDWLIYADYLDDQGVNHFIREDLQDKDPPWIYAARYKSVGTVVICNYISPIGPACVRGFSANVGNYGVDIGVGGCTKGVGDY
jgi:hypothetical protein